jgi:hypothetical protein
VPLQDREQVYCTTTRLGLFYLHTFVACAEASNRYAVCLCADGGVYTAQIEAHRVLRDCSQKCLKARKNRLFWPESRS